ncbi:sulfite exporter TauE/SafE family protein [Brevibacillus fluminis]|uniref:Sulfite exporter TauE/SafE family protein n=1 Tax=Brevibacillus fluminis TaxID=511487 RepID=A0A3M8DAK2_9BACL|nr:sulfite exporter TauE/SafE family protein [Brevibacillus fluminis]RNB85076.1 sulfite exporter TauE/SafE family protein [Brevibacillus fluminis]
MGIGIYEYGMVLLTGLLSAPHCMGMCGGMMSAWTLQAKKEQVLPAILAYNAGRICTYILIGSFMGFIGSFVSAAGQLVGIQGVANLLGGSFILLWVFRKYALPFATWSPTRLAPVQHFITAYQQKAGLLPVFLGGLLFGFIPCGLTYTMHMKAATTGSAMQGALTLLSFGMGTLPALLVIGLFAIGLGKAVRQRVLFAANVLAVTFGLLAILRGMVFNGWIPSISPWLW